MLLEVPVARTTILINTLSSTLAGLIRIVFYLYPSAGHSLAAVGVELDAISAVVIGGALPAGGYGFVAGTFIGVMLIGLQQTYIIFDSTLFNWWTKIVIVCFCSYSPCCNLWCCGLWHRVTRAVSAENE